MQYGTKTIESCKFHYTLFIICFLTEHTRPTKSDDLIFFLFNLSHFLVYAWVIAWQKSVWNKFHVLNCVRHVRYMFNCLKAKKLKTNLCALICCSIRKTCFQWTKIWLRRWNSITRYACVCACFLSMSLFAKHSSLFTIRRLTLLFSPFHASFILQQTITVATAWQWRFVYIVLCVCASVYKFVHGTYIVYCYGN